MANGSAQPNPMMRLLRVCLAPLAVALVLAGCGDDSAPPVDSAPADGTTAIDAVQIDASANEACEVLCSCMETYCDEMVADCMARCEGAPASVKSCWITHCGYAQAPGGAPIHCPHAMGDTDPEALTPEACLLPTAQ